MSPPLRRAEPEGADDPRFLRLFLLVDNAQTSFFAQFDHTLGEVVVADAVPKLPVQEIDGELPQGKVINVVDCLTKLERVE